MFLVCGVVCGYLIYSYSPIKMLAALTALVIAIATIRKVDWGVMVLVFLTYINFFAVVSNIHNSPPINKPLILFIFGATLIHIIYYQIRPQGLVKPFLLIGSYAFVCLMSLAYANNLNRTYLALAEFASAVMTGVIVLIVLQQGEMLRRTIWTLLFAGILMGGIVTYQFVTGTMTNNYWGFGQAEIRQIVGAVREYRAAGSIGDANFFAQVMVTLIPLGLERAWKEKKMRWRVLAMIASGLCFLAVVFSFSRGAFLALVAYAGMIMLYFKLRPTKILLLAVFALPLVFFIPSSYMDRINSIIDAIPGVGNGMQTDSAIRGRVSEIKVGWMMFVDHPVLGVGVGNYPNLYQNYSRKLGLDARLMDRSAHSLYLQIASETGLVGLAVFVFIMWNIFRGLKRAREDFLAAGNEDYASITSAFKMAMVGYFIAGLFLHTAFPQFLWLLTAVTLAIPNVARNELERARGTHR
jgi:putative inorganic carbon (hco3(-)) transporter